MERNPGAGRSVIRFQGCEMMVTMEIYLSHGDRNAFYYGPRECLEEIANAYFKHTKPFITERIQLDMFNRTIIFNDSNVETIK